MADRRRAVGTDSHAAGSAGLDTHCGGALQPNRATERNPVEATPENVGMVAHVPLRFRQEEPVGLH